MNNKNLYVYDVIFENLVSKIKHDISFEEFRALYLIDMFIDLDIKNHYHLTRKFINELGKIRTKNDVLLNKNHRFSEIRQFCYLVLIREFYIEGDPETFKKVRIYF